MRALPLLALPFTLWAQTRLTEPPQRGVKTDDRIAMLSKQAAARPSPATQALLAKAYIQKMRETVDFGYLARASEIVENILTHDGGNYEALRLRSEIAMERHEFQHVAEYSAEIIKFAPDDAWSWGTLGDAQMELGEYGRARDAYRKMVSLRPNLSSYNRLAWYEFVTGNAQGAIQLMRSAIAGDSDSPENTAWCLADLGRIQFKVGLLADAEASYRKALAEFAGYYPALAGLGQIETAQGKNELAIDNYKRAQAAVPLPEYAAALEVLYKRTGKPAEARKQQELIDVIDKMAKAANEKVNRNMAILYADEDRQLDRALELVQNEIAVRPDVYTHDALAWVLYKLKRYPEAGQNSKNALALGTPDPLFYYHAGMIAAAQGEHGEARANLTKALALNPEFDPAQAPIARKTLLQR
jgi:tetratricopeptide (TPR) repeat protein